MKLKSIVAAAVLAVTGVAANAAVYDLTGSSPSGFFFTETTAFSGGGFSFATGSGTVTGFSLYSAPSFVIGSSVQTGTAVGPLFSLDTKTFAAGTYFAKVTGTGTFAAHYSTVSAVPEPETYALMLGGLGVVGFIARRRKVS